MLLVYQEANLLAVSACLLTLDFVSALSVTQLLVCGRQPRPRLGSYSLLIQSFRSLSLRRPSSTPITVPDLSFQLYDIPSTHSVCNQCKAQLRRLSSEVCLPEERRCLPVSPAGMNRGGLEPPRYGFDSRVSSRMTSGPIDTCCLRMNL